MLNDITIGPITIHMYGLMIGIGYLSAYLVCCLRAKKKGLNEDLLWGILICSILGILIGSRLLFYLVNIPQIKEDPSILWNFRNGYVVYGGISFGVLFGYIYCRKKQAPFLSYAGCCYGSGIRQNRLFFCRLLLWQTDRFMAPYHLHSLRFCAKQCTAYPYTADFQCRKLFNCSFLILVFFKNKKRRHSRSNVHDLIQYRQIHNRNLPR